MEPYLIGITGIIALFILLAIGVHVGIALGFIGVFGLMLILGTEATVHYAASASFHFATSTGLLVLPCFILMGLLAARSGIGSNVFNSISKLVGRLPAGLALATFVGTTAFGTVVGTAGSTSMIFAQVACPEMRRHGYDKRFAYGLVTAAGLSGMLIPPSTLGVFYALTTGESVGKILFAGVGPGLLMDVLFSICAITMVLLKPQLAPRINIELSWRQRLSAIIDLWPVFIVGGVVLGGIYGGIFTPKEAGAWGVVIVLLIGFLGKRMNWSQLWGAVEEAVGIIAMIFLILVAGRLFARFLTVSGISTAVLEQITGTFRETWQILAVLVLIYLILGCFLEAYSIIMITVPVVYPVVTMMGIDPIWFGMVLILALHAGLLTPPLGFCVYAVKAVADNDVTLEDIFIGVLPFLFMLIILIALVIAFPPIATWLPDRMFQ